MKNIYRFIFTAFTLFFMTGCNTHNPLPVSKPEAPQDVQVFTTNNNAKITPTTIEKAFEAVGLTVLGNNDMNKPFKARFGKVHYKVYNLAMYINNDLTFKLIKKYPKFGALTPLTMSIWKGKDGSMNISTLSINGMARATGIPLTDTDLIAYAKLTKTALKKAMPNGHFKNLHHTVEFPNKSFAIDITSDIDLTGGETISDFIDDFEAEFEGELEPLGFLFPNYINVQEEIFNEHNYNEYDFYHTYSICKFDVIYPVSKLHPEAGAWAPCSFYLYKKKGENKMHMGFLGVKNWITTLDIQDKESIKPLKDAQGMIVKVLNEMKE